MMSRKQSSARTKARSRINKVAALVEPGATPGEQQAAETALVRLGTPLVTPETAGTHFDATVIRGLSPGSAAASLPGAGLRAPGSSAG
jgi:hypothetical protein